MASLSFIGQLNFIGVEGFLAPECFTCVACFVNQQTSRTGLRFIARRRSVGKTWIKCSYEEHHFRFPHLAVPSTIGSFRGTGIGCTAERVRGRYRPGGGAGGRRERAAGSQDPGEV